MTMGVYQLKQAPNYVCQHKGDNNSYDLFVCKVKPCLLKVKIQSRHSKQTYYNLFIKYSMEGEIEGWYCQCKVGARVVGCCAHVASVLWYLGYQRFLNNNQSHKLFQDFVLDASNVPDTDEESDCSSVPEE